MVSKPGKMCIGFIFMQSFLWLQIYLNDRSARVRVDGALSDRFHVTSGVPQGSVLKPILFLIYLDDLSRHTRYEILLFANDIKI